MTFSLSTLFESLTAWALDFFNTIITYFCTFIDSFMVPIANSFPNLSYESEVICSVAVLANYFIDFGYGFNLFLCYLIIAMALSFINWVLGLVPTVN